MQKITLIIILFVYQLVFSQNIQQAEYFWDNDPGQGNGNTLLALDGNFDQALETAFTNSANLPSEGDHVFYVRVKSQDGNWSPVFRKVVRIRPNNDSNFGVKIVQGEYFWDNDPGSGNAFNLLAFDGNFDQAFESVFSNISTLPSEGDHVLHVRIKSLDGTWGPVFRRVFRITSNNNTNLQVRIEQSEYFWDIDPGFGNGVPLLAFDGNFDQAQETISNSLTLPGAPGLHVLHLRTKAADGNWGPVFRKVIGFDVAFDQKVILQSPQDLAVNVDLSPTLVWDQLNQLQNYEFQVSVSPFFDSLLDSGLVSGSTSVSLSNLSSNTVYFWRVRVRENNNVSLWSDVWQFTTNNLLGVIEAERDQIIVFPNPASTNLFIQNSRNLNLLNYEIFDAAGRKMLSGNAPDQQINVSSLSAGLYILKLQSDAVESFVSQFLKVN